jgi:hypothetical protein
LLRNGLAGSHCLLGFDRIGREPQLGIVTEMFHEWGVRVR